MAASALRRALQPDRPGAPVDLLGRLAPGTRAISLTATASSRDQQAKAELCRFEIEEVAVSFGPPARCQVIAEAAHGPLLGVRPDSRPYRHSATDIVVQVRLGTTPVGLEEAVHAVPRDEHRLRPGSDRAGQLGQRRTACDEFSDLGQVVTSQPEPAMPCGV